MVKSFSRRGTQCVPVEHQLPQGAHSSAPKLTVYTLAAKNSTVERTSHTTVSFACQNDYESDFHFARVSRPICAAAALPPNRVSSGDSLAHR